MSSFTPSSPIHWSLIRLKGPDVIDYLHRLTTVNLKLMKAGEGRPGFLLTPQAKIKSYFYLWLIDKSQTENAEVLLEFDAGAQDKWKTELIHLIDQFHFAEKFTVTDVTDLQTRWFFPQQSRAETSLQTLVDLSGARLFHHGTREFGRAWVTAWGTSDQIAALSIPSHEVNSDLLNQWRIASAQPWVDSEITENSNPLEIGLHHAVAGNKGCYPGQEVIEKMISLGAPARRLIKLEGEGKGPQLGEALFSGTQEAGHVTSVTRSEESSDRFEALALAKKLYAQEGTSLSFGSAQATIVQVASYL